MRNFKRFISGATAFAMVTTLFMGIPQGVFPELSEILPNTSVLLHAEEEVAINSTNFPDDAFRTYVSENFDKDSNGTLSSSEMSAVSAIYANAKGISSLKGIEYFPSLKSLHCKNNSLTSLDLSNNTAVTYLDCTSNKLTSLVLGNNTVIETLMCGFNELTSLDVSKATALKTFNCSKNSLTVLKAGNKPSLQYIHCNDNNLSTLDISGDSALLWIDCSNNSLSSLSVSEFTELKNLYCSNNALTTLDVKSNTKLETLYCDRNELSSLNVTQNTLLANLRFNQNKISEIDLDNNTALKNLNSGYNKLTSLNLQNNPLLTFVNCNGNQLSSLDVSKNTALTTLDCQNNEIFALDLSKNTALTTLDCCKNCLSSLDVSNNTALTDFYCDGNMQHVRVNSPVDSIRFELSTLSGFAPSKASDWQGATYNIATKTLSNIADDGVVSYTYDCGNGFSETFKIHLFYSIETSGKCGLNAEYSLDENGTLTITGHGEVYGYLLPDEENGIPEEYEPMTLDRSLIRAVVIDDEIGNIREGAFDNCENLETVNIRSNATLEKNAFLDCHSLYEYTISGGNDHYSVVDGVLFNEAQTELISYPAGKTDLIYKVSDSVQKIANDAFARNEYIRDVYIPDSVHNLGDGAFYACSSLEIVELPEFVTTIGIYTFAECTSLKSIIIPDGAYISSNAFENCKNLIAINLCGNIIENNAFIGCNNLSNIHVTIYDADELIGVGGLPTDESRYCISDYNFYPKNGGLDSVCDHAGYCPLVHGYGECGNDATFRLYNGVLTISGTGSLFTYNYLWDNPELFGYFPEFLSAIRNAKTVVIESGITEIDARLFHNKEKLEEIYIGDTLSTISGTEFLGYCDNIRIIEVDPKNATFKSVDNVLFSKDQKILYRYPSANGATSFSIPATVVEIKEHAFEAADLETVKIGSAVKTIGYGAFRGSNLTSITIPAGVTELGVDSFSFCENLASITVPSTNTKYCVVNGVLYNKSISELYCMPAKSGKTSFTVPSKVKRIEQGAFSVNHTLKDITLNDGLEFIGMYAFSCNFVVETIEIPETVTEIGEGAFSNCINLETVKMPKNNVEFYGYLFIKDISLKNVNLPDGIIRIPDGTFMDCSSLESLIIPEGTTEIIHNAFIGCTSLKNLHIPESMENMNDTFGGINTLEHIHDRSRCGQGGLPSDGTRFFNLDEYGICELDENCPLGFSTKIDSEGVCGNGVTYKVFKGVLTISGSGRMYDYMLTEYNMNGPCYDTPWYDVKNKIREIVIEEGVEYIGCSSLCGLDNLEQITIPASVSEMGMGAIDNNPLLARIIVAENSEYYTAVDNVLFTKDMKTLVRYPAAWYHPLAIAEVNYVVPESVETIGAFAFSGRSNGLCKTTDINAHNVKKIENCAFYESDAKWIDCLEATEFGGLAFYDSDISQFHIGPNVSKIGFNAFMNCQNLERIEVDPSNDYFESRYGILFSKGGDTLIFYPMAMEGTTYKVDAREIGEYAFVNNNILEDIVIGSTVEKIGKGAFECVNNAKNVTFLGLPKTVDAKAFSFWGLETIHIPYGKAISSYAGKWGLPKSTEVDYHIFSNKTEYDDTHHWYPCQDADCTAQIAKEMHNDRKVIYNIPDELDDGSVEYRCSVCDRLMNTRPYKEVMPNNISVTFNNGAITRYYPDLDTALKAFENTTEDITVNILNPVEVTTLNIPKNASSVKFIGHENNLKINSTLLTITNNVEFNHCLCGSASSPLNIKVNAGKKLFINSMIDCDSNIGSITGSTGSQLELFGTTVDSISTFDKLDTSCSTVVNGDISGIKVFRGDIILSNKTGTQNVTFDNIVNEDEFSIYSCSIIQMIDNNGKIAKLTIKDIDDESKVEISVINNANELDRIPLDSGRPVLYSTGKDLTTCKVDVKNKTSDGKELELFKYGNEFRAEYAGAITVSAIDDNGHFDDKNVPNLTQAFAFMTDPEKKYSVCFNTPLTTDSLTIPSNVKSVDFHGSPLNLDMTTLTIPTNVSFGCDVNGVADKPLNIKVSGANKTLTICGQTSNIGTITGLATSRFSVHEDIEVSGITTFANVFVDSSEKTITVNGNITGVAVANGNIRLVNETGTATATIINANGKIELVDNTSGKLTKLTLTDVPSRLVVNVVDEDGNVKGITAGRTLLYTASKDFTWNLDTNNKTENDEKLGLFISGREIKADIPGSVKVTNLSKGTTREFPSFTLALNSMVYPDDYKIILGEDITLGTLSLPTKANSITFATENGSALKFSGTTLNIPTNVSFECDLVGTNARPLAVKVAANKSLTIADVENVAISGTATSSLNITKDTTLPSLMTFKEVKVYDGYALTVTGNVSGVTTFYGDDITVTGNVSGVTTFYGNLKLPNPASVVTITNVDYAEMTLTQINGKFAKVTISDIEDTLRFIVIDEEDLVVDLADSTVVLNAGSTKDFTGNVQIMNANPSGQTLNAFLYGRLIKAEYAGAITLTVDEESRNFPNLDLAFAAMNEAKDYTLTLNCDVTTTKTTLPTKPTSIKINGVGALKVNATSFTIPVNTTIETELVGANARPLAVKVSANKTLTIAGETTNLGAVSGAATSTLNVNENATFPSLMTFKEVNVADTKTLSVSGNVSGVNELNGALKLLNSNGKATAVIKNVGSAEIMLCEVNSLLPKLTVTDVLTALDVEVVNDSTKVPSGKTVMWAGGVIDFTDKVTVVNKTPTEKTLEPFIYGREIKAEYPDAITVTVDETDTNVPNFTKAFALIKDSAKDYTITLNESFTETQFTIPTKANSITFTTENDSVLNLNMISLNVPTNVSFECDVNGTNARPLAVKVSANKTLTIAGETTNIGAVSGTATSTLNVNENATFPSLMTFKEVNVADTKTLSVSGNVSGVNELNGALKLLNSNGKATAVIKNVGSAEIMLCEVNSLLPKLTVTDVLTALNIEVVNDSTKVPSGKTVMWAGGTIDFTDKVTVVNKTPTEKDLRPFIYGREIKAEYPDAITVTVDEVGTNVPNFTKAFALITDSTKDYTITLNESVSEIKFTVPAKANSLTLKGKTGDETLNLTNLTAITFPVKTTIEDLAIESTKAFTLTASKGLALQNFKSDTITAIRGTTTGTLILGKTEFAVAPSITTFGTIDVTDEFTAGKSLTTTNLNLKNGAGIVVPDGISTVSTKTLSGEENSYIKLLDGFKPITITGTTADSISGTIKLVGDTIADNAVVFTTRTVGDNVFDLTAVRENAGLDYELAIISGKAYMKPIALVLETTDGAEVGKYALWNDMVTEINTIADADAEYNVRLLMDYNIGGAMKLPTAKKYNTLNIIGTAETSDLYFTGTSFALTGNLGLEKINLVSKNATGASMKYTIATGTVANGYTLCVTDSVLDTATISGGGTVEINSSSVMLVNTTAEVSLNNSEIGGKLTAGTLSLVGENTVKGLITASKGIVADADTTLNILFVRTGMITVNANGISGSGNITFRIINADGTSYALLGTETISARFMGDGFEQLVLSDENGEFRLAKVGTKLMLEELVLEENNTPETELEEIPTEEDEEVTDDEEVIDDDTPSEDEPSEDEPTEDEPTEDEPSEDEPTEDEPTEDEPTEDTPTEDIPTEDTPIDDVPTDETPTDDTPTENIPDENITDETPVTEELVA